MASTLARPTRRLPASTKTASPAFLSTAEGKYLVPSVVLFEDGQTLVGDVAKDSAVAPATGWSRV